MWQQRIEDLLDQLEEIQADNTIKPASPQPVMNKLS